MSAKKKQETICTEYAGTLINLDPKKAMHDFDHRELAEMDEDGDQISAGGGRIRNDLALVVKFHPDAKDQDLIRLLRKMADSIKRHGVQLRYYISQPAAFKAVRRIREDGKEQVAMSATIS